MGRKFRIEYRQDCPIANAIWSVMFDNCSMSGVEAHCRANEINWKRGLFRLIELKPITVEFKTTVDFKETV